MSKAEELLNSLVEAYVAESDPSSDSHIVIGADRFIIIPDELKRIAVQYDHNMRTVTFDCPRYYDGRDMSKMTVYINIRGPKGAPHSYIADNVRVDTSNPSIMHFDWTLRRPVTDVKGSLVFLVCIRKADVEGNEENHWNSERNTDLYISEGMEYEEFEEYPYSDIVTQLLQRMDDVERLANPEVMQRYANTWLDENSNAVLEDIQSKGNEVLNSIPEEYAETYNYAAEGARTKADAIIRTVEGESIAVSDSSGDYLRGLRVCGKTTQVQTTGAQLLNLPDTEFEQLGVKWTSKNGVITAVGVCESSSVSTGNVISQRLTGMVGTYFISGNSNSVMVYVRINKAGVDTWHNNTSFTLDGTENDVQVYLQASGVGNAVNDVLYPMLNAGDIALPWEPYTGGVASPSPDWPQEIVSIENPTVKIVGANLVPFLKEGSIYKGQGLTLKVYADRCVCSGVPERAYASVANATITLPKGIYTVSGGKMEDGAMYLQVRVVRNDVASHYFGGDSFTIYGDETTIAVTVQVGNTTAEVVDYTFYPILNVGNSIVDYEPYIAGPALVIPHVLPAIPVSSGGNYTDANGKQWICDEVDFERGVYVQRVKKTVITGTPDFNETEDCPGRFSWFCLTGEYRSGREACLCNYATWRSWGIGDGARDYGALSINQIYYSPAESMTATEVNAKFARMIAEGNPPAVIGQLETPIKTQLSAEELNAFRAIRSNYPNTTVLNDSNVKMELKYNADTQLYIDNKIAYAVAALANKA